MGRSGSTIGARGVGRAGTRRESSDTLDTIEVSKHLEYVLDYMETQVEKIKT